MRRLPSLALASLLFCCPLAAGAEEDPAICIGIEDLTADEVAVSLAEDAYTLVPVGDVKLISQSQGRTMTRDYDEDADGKLTASGSASLDSSSCSRVTTRSYEYFDEDGELQLREVQCGFSCNGGGGCTLSGCTPGSGGSCTSFICRGGSFANPCVGTCTQTSTSGPPPAPNNKG